MTRARLVLAALLVVVVAAVVGVLVESWRSAARERVLRHQLVAERLFDGMERELTALLAREDGRPFVDYRPDDGFIGERPEYVVGWFQVDPEGRFAVAHPVDEPTRARLRTEAERLEGWGEEAADSTSGSTLTLSVPVDVPQTREVVTSRTPAPTPTPKQVPTEVSNPNADNLSPDWLPVENNFNNAVVQRAGRDLEQRQQVSLDQLADFTRKAPAAKGPPEGVEDPAPELTEVVEVETITTSKKRVWVPVEIEVPATSEVEIVDVLVGAMVPGAGVQPDSLVLHRTVRLDRRSWVQGVLLDGPALRDSLVRTALDGTGLQDAITVAWGAEAEAPPDRLLFEHRFAEPFEDFVANAIIEPLPATGAGLDLNLWLTCGVLLVMTLAGLLAVHHMLVLTTRQAQEREDFVSAVTHELKSPLTSIRMYTEMLEGGVVGDEAGRQAYYGTIRTEAERLTRLVDDVLVFSRMERGLPIAAGSTGQLGSVVDEVVRMYGPQARAAGAEIVLSITDQARPVGVDRDALSQVLTNLLDNAVKFSSDAPDRRVHVEADMKDGRARLSVRDHGPGVPATLLRRMFEPFVRGERELTRRTKGTGIGLALVRRLVAHLGGEVDARNHPEGGLEISVWVPAQG